VLSVEFGLEFDREQKVLLITMGTVVTEASALAAASAVRTFVASHDPWSVVADLTAVERIEASASFVRYLAARPPAIQSGRMVILVARRDETYGMSRMFQLLRRGAEDRFHVVHEMGEAYELLGVSSLGLAPVIPL